MLLSFMLNSMIFLMFLLPSAMGIHSRRGLLETAEEAEAMNLLRTGFVCHGSPPNGWGDLDPEAPNLDACLDLCLASSTCDFVTYNEDLTCTSWLECADFREVEFSYTYGKSTTPPATTTQPPAATTAPSTASANFRMIAPFSTTTTCENDPSAVLQGITNITEADCMTRCIDTEDCVFADFEPHLVGDTGYCRLLTRCNETTACGGPLVTVLKKVGQMSFNSPQWMMTCPRAPTMKTSCMTHEDYNHIVQEIKHLFVGLSDVCNSADCEIADFSGCLLRMAGHDFMDFNGTGDGRGGADGCTDMDDEDNGGLAECLYKGEFDHNKVSLNDAYQLFCHKVSLADFIVIAAEAVMEHLAHGEAKQVFHDGFRHNFKFGRETAFEGCQFSVGVLPNPADSCNAVERVYVENMGLTWSESAALMGVHTLGRADLRHSGYHGWWTAPELSRRFGNSYYSNMFLGGWCRELNVNNCTAELEAAGHCHPKHQWVRCDVFHDELDQEHEFMLNTDLCLVYSDQTDGDGQLKASEDECCAWVHSTKAETFNITTMIQNHGNTFCNRECGSKYEVDGRMVTYECGKDSFGQLVRELDACCAASPGIPDCRTTGLGPNKGPGGPAEEAVRMFANDEVFWANAFVPAW
eukprot:CAMPEP_0170597046 /NCGR_PEP_ID=MMETSP0224-20130122/15487_1 /TAXON_ID=285029 /ORGANISM="Togula jolla, Strain CCCM 725" /LENGTH=636 /DNA_ID=CAMNT_0010921469 /DNA_START=64 /DNA_END=1971 /DNA_ORIENTATION=+